MEPPRHLTPSSREWPDELRHIDAPPEELWLRGALASIPAAPRVAVVGSRAPTPYGEGQARRFAGRLGSAGIVIVSGLARGIDAAAHSAALDAGGRTLAVLGSGVDRPWPRGPLTDRMLAEALLLSEFLPGQDPRRHHFPLRNRVISALSVAVVVVEAAHASGSLVTARWAADQGKQVFALPGRVDHPMARGCHRLIREGATLVESPEEVLTELGLGPAPGSTGPCADEAGPQHPILEALRGETLTVDELSTRLRRPAVDLLADLVELELSDRVVRAPGGLFRRVVP